MKNVHEETQKVHEQIGKVHEEMKKVHEHFEKVHELLWKVTLSGTFSRCLPGKRVKHSAYGKWIQ